MATNNWVTKNSMDNNNATELLLSPSATVSFADVAHQTLTFDVNRPSEKLILELLGTCWVQRLRSISQTGNTRQVYMFAEHSRFGHSLGVAYLAVSLMKHLHKLAPDQVSDYETAVGAAALLHDIGHVAPGSHLGERLWGGEDNESAGHKGRHESVGIRVIKGDTDVNRILRNASPKLPELVSKILSEDASLPAWTTAIISGGGWNADRGNWAIVDSAMCAVTYGRYNVTALIDAFRLTEDGRMVLHESRIDALTHFFVARDSMYRQIYQHRVLQAIDSLTLLIVKRLRFLITTLSSGIPLSEELQAIYGIYCDQVMCEALTSPDYGSQLQIDTVFQMTEQWWGYHLQRWCSAKDSVLRDLSCRLRDRQLFKTIRLEDSGSLEGLISKTKAIASKLGFDPEYYVALIDELDAHRGKAEPPPMVLRDNGKIVPATEIEPLIAQLLARPDRARRWLAVPKEVKEALGRVR